MLISILVSFALMIEKSFASRTINIVCSILWRYEDFKIAKLSVTLSFVISKIKKLIGLERETGCCKFERIVWYRWWPETKKLWATV